jgi:hypothetical protein
MLKALALPFRAEIARAQMAFDAGLIHDLQIARRPGGNAYALFQEPTRLVVPAVVTVMLNDLCATRGGVDRG